MPVFLERFVLAVLAALLGTLVLNPLKFDVRQRISLAVATISLAYFTAHTVHRYNHEKTLQPKTQAASVIPSGERAAAPPSEPATAPEQTPKRRRTATPKKAAPAQDRSVRVGDRATLTNSPIITGDHNQVTIKTDLPEPKLELFRILDDEQQGDLYVTRVRLVITAKASIPNLRLTARHPSIISFDVGPERGGMFITGHSGVRPDEGFAFTNVSNAYGSLILTIIKKTAGLPEIIYDVE